METITLPGTEICDDSPKTVWLWLGFLTQHNSRAVRTNTLLQQCQPKPELNHKTMLLGFHDTTPSSPLDGAPAQRLLAHALRPAWPAVF